MKPLEKEIKRLVPRRNACFGLRLWLYRAAAALLAPCLILAVLEGVLRLVNFGYPVDFFIPAEIEGRAFYVPNDRFGFRFFPPMIARTPLAQRLEAQKPPHTFRIFLFGESAAEGDPDPSFGVGRYLEVLLNQHFPGTHFEVVCVAMTAIDSHAILPIARQCAGLDGDMWLIYMGNNEMIGPYGAGTVFGPHAPPVSLVRASLAAKGTRCGQLIERLWGRTGASATAPKAWGGLRLFKDQQLRRDDPSRLRAYGNFARNLESILQAAHKAGVPAGGVPVLLSTVASNLKDCAPFASLHRAGLGEDQKAAWEENYRAGMAREESGDLRGAEGWYQKACAIDPEFAELRFRLGECELGLGNATAARRDFELARDCDALVFRADTEINRIISQAANRHRGDRVVLVDAVETLAGHVPEGIAGEDLFYEHVHLNGDGNYLLAKVFAEAMSAQLPAAVTAGCKKEWVTADECDRRLGFSLWDRCRTWQAGFSRVSEPPFSTQLGDAARAKRYMSRLEEFHSQMSLDAREKARSMYREAVDAAPDDPFLRANYARFLGELGEWEAAAKEQERVCRLLPQAPVHWHKAGLIEVRRNRTETAAELFKHALALRRDYAPALNELGLILENQRKTEEAEECFTNAIRLSPAYEESYINLGFSRQESGCMAEALAQYQVAAGLQPEGPAAYFSAAASLANEGRPEEALPRFQAAVSMKPDFWQARYLLGVELGLAGQAREAQAQLGALVRLRPDFAKGHLNFGMALVQDGKLDAALAEFESALKIDPDSEQARRAVQGIKELRRR